MKTQQKLIEITITALGLKSRVLTKEEKQAILQKHADLDKRLAMYRSQLANKINK